MTCSCRRTTNGPINLANVSGTVTARAQNGPVNFVGSTGAVDLETQNGPIGVRLDGERWTTGSLTAHAQNGPVKVEVPQNFASGVRVESSNARALEVSGYRVRVGEALVGRRLALD